ncbi:MAG: hypothetical protein A2Z99_10350 [Treponema sp. GWB1_62_6]|nr:MAG: hypothetical protein A2Z99_10350 [Treponema sp. GWB1_62_6]OHE66994.1 MAG: hypothetical protein A2001_08095 [Treponema sp. GWC1_61_84]OHE70908.1 MAG: hypothetical protein A2413_13290 [Treponema sp. RIFOXYC1_FULL_61_9]HCM25448.1 HAD family phosphatase [Treponema sp.]
MGIKAVAFDFGNVISLPQDTDDLNRLAEIVGVDRTTMNELAMKDRADYDRGALSGKEYYARGLSKLGKVFDEEALAALVKADLESWANVNPATVALMDEVKAAGAKIAILSNMPHEFLALSRVRFPFFSNLDAGIYSCEIGVNKPDRAIYEALLTALDSRAGEVVFFDDIAANVSGARALGMEAFVWTDAASARDRLVAFGVLS